MRILMREMNSNYLSLVEGVDLHIGPNELFFDRIFWIVPYSRRRKELAHRIIYTYVCRIPDSNKCEELLRSGLELGYLDLSPYYVDIFSSAKVDPVRFEAETPDQE